MRSGAARAHPDSRAHHDVLSRLTQARQTLLIQARNQSEQKQYTRFLRIQATRRQQAKLGLIRIAVDRARTAAVRTQDQRQGAIPGS